MIKYELLKGKNILIIVKISDGLGNQMFQYAYAKTLQMNLPHKVYLDISDINNYRNNSLNNIKWRKLCDKRNYQLDHFLITLPIIDEEKVNKILKKRNEYGRFLNYCEELRMSPTVYFKESECRETGIKYTRYQNYYVEGTFFDKKYNENIRLILKNDFRPKKELSIPENIAEILKTQKTVSLHIRRGDFLKVGRNISESDYYERAIQYLKSKFRNIFLLIFSDDIEWVKRNKKFELKHLFISDKDFSDSQELILMSMCTHNIIANSTYSYWGAWLNSNKEKIVIAPKGWRKRIIPESWILL